MAGRSFIVTGGTQGLGLEIARQLKAGGASSLALVSRTAEKGEVVANELSEDGTCDAHFVYADMSSGKSIKSGSVEQR